MQSLFKFSAGRIPAFLPMRRSPMRFHSRIPETASQIKPSAPLKNWGWAAARRRAALFSLTVLSAWAAGTTLHFILIESQSMSWHLPIISLFVLLSGWIAANFWISVFGFFVLLTRKDRYNLSRLPDTDTPIAPTTKTAVVFLVHNEDLTLVFAGLKTIYESIKKTGTISAFDFYILSDTTDPDQAVAEEVAWAATCEELQDYDRIFYRRRKNRIQKKSGNIAEFCRRWGIHYKYMIALDADSLITGDLAVRMVKVMEKTPDVGILQTTPKAVLQNNLFSRVSQFANHLYGPLLAAGFHFWYLGDAGFWGHNAIIRMEPFMKYCALPKLSKRGPFGGDILSHDFVESALMRRAGFGVWLAYEMEGSYEQVPPNLLTELGRDRRWCQGNLQHLRLLSMNGLSFGHRVLFLIGNFFYFSSLFWFLFLVASTVGMLKEKFETPVYFSENYSLFPQWPVYHYALAATLLIITACFLLLPKLLAVALIAARQQSRHFGGVFKITLSLLLETLASALFAPSRMLFHTWHLVAALLGQKTGWNAALRNEKQVPFREAVKAHGIGTVAAIVWGSVLYYIQPLFFWWSSLFLIPLALSIPICMASSRADLGITLRRWGLFLVPEEQNPPQELVAFQEERRRFWSFFASFETNLQKSGFEQAVRHPIVYEWHARLARRSGKSPHAGVLQSRQSLVEKAVSGNLKTLDAKEKTRILSDEKTLSQIRKALAPTPPRAESENG